jgi:type II secretory pathway component PulJ
MIYTVSILIAAVTILGTAVIYQRQVIARQMATINKLLRHEKLEAEDLSNADFAQMIAQPQAPKPKMLTPEEQRQQYIYDQRQRQIEEEHEATAFNEEQEAEYIQMRTPGSFPVVQLNSLEDYVNDL